MMFGAEDGIVVFRVLNQAVSGDKGRESLVRRGFEFLTVCTHEASHTVDG